MVPVVGANHRFVLRRRPRDPAPSVTVDATGVAVQPSVNLDLVPRDDARRVALERGMDVDIAVAVRPALELRGQSEVAIGLLGGEVAVLLGDALTEDRAVDDLPLLVADLPPTGEVLRCLELRRTGLE